MKKILLVEDNQEISNSITEYLELEGFLVKQVFRGDNALDEAIEGVYDLILLDISLPGMDGFRVAEKVKNKKDIPILMITAKDSIDDKLKGFDVGAIDYIVKPFDLRELEARISIALQGNVGFFIFEDIKINMKKRIFLNNEKAVKITQKEFLILEYLLENKGNAVSRTDLIEYLWGGDNLFEGDSILDVYISNIRKKLSKGIIETIKGFGYKINE